MLIIGYRRKGRGKRGDRIKMENIGSITTIIVVALIILTIYLGVKVVPQSKVFVVERFGKYYKTLNAGLSIIVPYLDKVAHKIDILERQLEAQKISVITKDNVTITVDAVIYYEPTDPKKLVYNVGDFIQAATKLAQTNLRNVVGDLELDSALTSRETINTSLKLILDEATDKWGTRVVTVSYTHLTLPTICSV